jgi:hypothetical protein
MVARDSGKSLGKLSLWAGLSGCRLTLLKRVTEAGVEETRSRSVRALVNLLRIQVAYIPEGGTLGRSCDLTNH